MGCSAVHVVGYLLLSVSKKFSGLLSDIVASLMCHKNRLMETSTSTLAAHFPVAHKKTSLIIKGNKTDVIVCRYDDYFMVMVTQLGCVGTILHARKEGGVSIDPTFSVSVILGKRDEPLLVACGRQLIEQISSCGSSRHLVLTLGLKDHSPGTLKEVISVIVENRLW